MPVEHQALVGLWALAPAEAARLKAHQDEA